MKRLLHRWSRAIRAAFAKMEESTSGSVLPVAALPLIGINRVTILPALIVAQQAQAPSTVANTERLTAVKPEDEKAT